MRDEIGQGLIQSIMLLREEMQVMNQRVESPRIKVKNDELSFKSAAIASMEQVIEEKQLHIRTIQETLTKKMDKIAKLEADSDLLVSDVRFYKSQSESRQMDLEEKLAVIAAKDKEIEDLKKPKTEGPKEKDNPPQFMD